MLYIIVDLGINMKLKEKLREELSVIRNQR